MKQVVHCTATRVRLVSVFLLSAVLWLSVNFPVTNIDNQDVGQTLHKLPHENIPGSKRSPNVNPIRSLRAASINIRLSSADNRTVYLPEIATATRKLIHTCQHRGAAFYRSAGRLATVSVIITFHSGETLYNVLHTLHSIFQRTPADLLQQVVLVDDFSKKDEFGEPLELYVKAVFGAKVQIIRNERNVGLIQSRLKGIRQSTGQVFVVMDSHSEVQPLWLEPLLFEIVKNRRTAASSVMDWMSRGGNGEWHYTYRGPYWTVFFDWRLVFGWQNVPQQLRQTTAFTDPIKSKAMIGAYLAMDKKFFQEIGEFDEGMEFWGAENIDLALRTWLFGGVVLVVPCSRVAHLEVTGMRDYRDKFTQVIERNYKRLVEVWFDDNKKYYYALKPDALNIDAGDLTERFAVKKRALHDFNWFLTNVFPELGMFDRNSFAWGHIMNVGSKQCLDQDSCLSNCATATSKQTFFWNNKFEIRLGDGFKNVLANRRQLMFADKFSAEREDKATWIHWQNGPLIDYTSRLCLETFNETNRKHRVELRRCHYKPSQQWTFTNYSTQYHSLLLQGGWSKVSIINKMLKLVHRQVDDVRNKTTSSLDGLN